LCKLCAVGKDRTTAIERMKRALSEFEIRGIKTTLPLLKRIIMHPDFSTGRFDTTFIEKRFKVLTDYVEEENELFKIARFLAEITAEGGNRYCL